MFQESESYPNESSKLRAELFKERIERENEKTSLILELETAKQQLHHSQLASKDLKTQLDTKIENSTVDHTASISLFSDSLRRMQRLTSFTEPSFRTKFATTSGRHFEEPVRSLFPRREKGRSESAGRVGSSNRGRSLSPGMARMPRSSERFDDTSSERFSITKSSRDERMKQLSIREKQRQQFMTEAKGHLYRCISPKKQREAPVSESLSATLDRIEGFPAAVDASHRKQDALHSSSLLYSKLRRFPAGAPGTPSMYEYAVPEGSLQGNQPSDITQRVAHDIASILSPDKSAVEQQGNHDEVDSSRSMFLSPNKHGHLKAELPQRVPSLQDDEFSAISMVHSPAGERKAAYPSAATTRPPSPPHTASSPVKDFRPVTTSGSSAFASQLRRDPGAVASNHVLFNKYNELTELYNKLMNAYIEETAEHNSMRIEFKHELHNNLQTMTAMRERISFVEKDNAALNTEVQHLRAVVEDQEKLRTDARQVEEANQQWQYQNRMLREELDSVKEENAALKRGAEEAGLYDEQRYQALLQEKDALTQRYQGLQLGYSELKMECQRRELGQLKSAEEKESLSEKVQRLQQNAHEFSKHSMELQQEIAFLQEKNRIQRENEKYYQLVDIMEFADSAQGLEAGLATVLSAVAELIESKYNKGNFHVEIELHSLQQLLLKLESHIDDQRCKILEQSRVQAETAAKLSSAEMKLDSYHDLLTERDRRLLHLEQEQSVSHAYKHTMASAHDEEVNKLRSQLERISLELEGQRKAYEDRHHSMTHRATSPLKLDSASKDGRFKSPTLRSFSYDDAPLRKEQGTISDRSPSPKGRVGSTASFRSGSPAKLSTHSRTNTFSVSDSGGEDDAKSGEFHQDLQYIAKGMASSSSAQHRSAAKDRSAAVHRSVDSSGFYSAQEHLKEMSELEQRAVRAEIRCDLLSNQLKSMPGSIAVAQAEKRVLECRLNRAQETAEANVRQLQEAMAKQVNDLQAFIRLEKSEKGSLLAKVQDQAATIHQLTHHLKLLQAEQRKQEFIINNTPSTSMHQHPKWASQVFHEEKMDLSPPPWADTSLSRNHVSTSAAFSPRKTNK